MRNTDKIKSYYAKRLGSKRSASLLTQVGKTVNGVDISNEQFSTIIESIISSLHINKDDIIIDIGCANGLVTREIAKECKKIQGIDISKDLIAIAQEHSMSDNIRYTEANCLKYDYKGFNKAYMYEALQHLKYKELPTLLDRLKRAETISMVLLGSIPDAERLFNFYNNKARREAYYTSLENGEPHLGNWWYMEHIEVVCRKKGIKANFISQDKTLHTAHYRFDALLEL